MTDEPFDVEAPPRAHLERLRAKAAQIVTWVDEELSLLPDPPPKYEYMASGVHGWVQVVSTENGSCASEFNPAHYPDPLQRAREECARLNGNALAGYKLAVDVREGEIIDGRTVTAVLLCHRTDDHTNCTRIVLKDTNGSDGEEYHYQQDSLVRVGARLNEASR